MRVRRNLVQETGQRRTLALIFCILLMDVVGMTILYPVAPYIVRRYSNRALTLTALLATYSAAQFVAAPALGKLSDRFGRRSVLLVSLFGSAVGYVLFGVAGALWVLFLSRLIDGITAGNQSTAAAYIVDVSTPESRARNLGLIGVAWGVGLIVGPALGGALGQFSVVAPAYAAALLSLACMGLCFALLPESLPTAHRETAGVRVADLNPCVSIGQIARSPGMAWLLLPLCLFYFAFNGINSTETLFLIGKFAARPGQLGGLLVLAGISIAVAQRLLQPLVGRYGERATAVAALTGEALSSLATVLAPALWLVYPVVVLRTVTSSLIFPTLGALMTSMVEERERGALIGVTTALNSLMSMLGSLWAGVVYDRVMPGAPYGIGAGLFALAAVLLARVR